MPDHKCVVRNKRFESDLSRLKTKDKRIDQFVEATEIILAKCSTPDEATLLSESLPPIYFLPMIENRYAIHYTFNKTHVVLLSFSLNENEEKK